MRSIALAICGLAVALSLQCGGSTCNLDKHTERVDAALKRWDAIVEIARQTPQELLEEPISNLEEIHSEVAYYPPPTCATRAHAKLVKYMDHMIDGFRASMQLQSEENLLEHFIKAEAALDEYYEMIDKLHD
ncbi:MAG: hypothetical protein HOC20_01515 [Chloroflexi bacterium]|jgi:hypothetical protein|nr:hypothetical protein [Chloroflexota bacterium]